MLAGEIVEPIVEAFNNYLRGEEFDKRALKRGKGVLDGLCPHVRASRTGQTRTPAFRKNGRELERALVQARRDHGKSLPSDDMQVFLMVRTVVRITEQVAKSHGTEVESARQQMRRDARWARDFWIKLGPDAAQQAAAD